MGENLSLKVKSPKKGEKKRVREREREREGRDLLVSERFRVERDPTEKERERRKE